MCIPSACYHLLAHLRRLGRFNPWLFLLLCPLQLPLFSYLPLIDANPLCSSLWFILEGVDRNLSANIQRSWELRSIQERGPGLIPPMFSLPKQPICCKCPQTLHQCVSPSSVFTAGCFPGTLRVTWKPVRSCQTSCLSHAWQTAVLSMSQAPHW